MGLGMGLVTLGLPGERDVQIVCRSPFGKSQFLHACQSISA